MPKSHTISKEQAEEVRELRKTIKDKQVDKRLKAVQLRGEGKNNKAIAEQLETSTDVISHWVSLFISGGLDAILPKKRTGRPLNLSFEEEAKMLAEFEAKAAAAYVGGIRHPGAAALDSCGGEIRHIRRRDYTPPFPPVVNLNLQLRKRGEFV